jgi:hypothetical protein
MEKRTYPRPDEVDRRSATILDWVRGYYAGKLAVHGPSARGVDWNSADSHKHRHRQFLRLLEGDRAASVLDLGCGYGDFFAYLRSCGFSGHYIGCDLAKEMIEAARNLHGEESDRIWRVCSSPSESADYAIASGIFNVKGNVSPAAWTDHVYRTIDVLANTGRRGFGFNVLTTCGDPLLRRADLFYAEPASMLTHCLSKYGRSVALLQDYGLWEFTLLVRRD